MNNYEHLVQGGIEALMMWANYATTTCQCCVGCDSQSRKADHHRYGVLDNSCKERQCEWLRGEYVEPDSWDKLLDDLKQMETVCDYCGAKDESDCNYRRKNDHFGCLKSFVLDVAERIEKLRG